MKDTRPSRDAVRGPGGHSVAFALLLAVVGLAAVALLLAVLAPREHRQAVSRWEERLEAMADDRKRAIDRWVADGRADAAVVASYPTVRYLASGRRSGPYPFPVEAGAETHLRELLTSFVAAHGYGAAYLVGADGGVRERSLGSPPPDAGCIATARASAEAPTGLVALHPHPDGSVHVAFSSPVRAGGEAKPASDSLVLEAPASDWLFPLLEHGPFRSRSFEAHVVARENGIVRFVSPLRFEPAPPLTVARSFATPGLAGAAALEGREGFGAFVDYRGASVLAATRRLETVPWGLVVKVDRDEALADVRRELGLTGLAAGAVYIALLAFGYSVWLRQRSRYQVAAAHSEARTALALADANDVIMLVSLDGRIRDVLGAAERLYGRPPSELRGLSIADLRPSDTGHEALANLQSVMARGAGVFETLHCTREGRQFPVEVSARLRSLENENIIISIVRDITERKAAEEKIRFLNRVLRTQSEISQLMVRETDEQSLLAEACRIAVEHGGFRMAWVGRTERETGRVRPVAWAGAEDGYVAEADIRFDEGPRSRGPTGTAIREGRTALVGDMANDEGFQPWREAALARGYRSSAACPLRVRREVVGALNLHASTPGAFSAEILALVEEITSDIGFALESIDERRLREQAEAHVRESETRFRRLAENAPDLIYRYRLHPEPGFEYVSPASIEMTGYTPEEHYADPQLGLKIIHPEDRPRLESLMRAESASGSPVTLRWIRKDGSMIWTEVHQTAIRDEEGRVAALEGISRDVTDRRRREESLRKLSRAVEQSPASVMITDTTGAIEYVNPKFTHVSGYRLEEVYGQNPRILKSGQVPSDTYAELWRTITGGEEWRGELCNRRKNGELFWESASISPIVDEEDRITHFVAVKEDITDRTRTEAALAQARVELHQAQKMEAIGRLAGAIAHDFNNLLNVITGYGELLARSLKEGDPGRGRIEQILKAAERGAGLTRQLLAFSRRQVLTPRVLSLTEVVRDIEKMLRRVIGEDIELIVRTSDDLGSTRVDPGQVEQVIMNLVVNARDAMPTGGVLTLETADVELDEAYAAAHRPLAAGPYVLLAVSDSGVGMDEATQARVFEPFFTTKPPGEGTGLGLSTVYGIVKQSGGFIWVYSEPGRGTSFKIYLPRVDESPERQAPAPAEAPSAPRGETILVVEDQPALREMVREALESLGYVVLEAECGEQALEVAGDHAGRIDLMITDVVMPRMGGRELAERIGPLRPEMRVLFCSGYSSEMIGRQAMLEPGLLLLEKPFTIAALARKVREALEERANPDP